MRAVGMNVEVFHNGSMDLGKQIQYRVKKGIEHFLVINQDSTFTLKISEGEEKKFANLEELFKFLGAKN
jgi:hypothetical protein